VDKFQGREAPVVIYSMATSSAEQAPRGMEFLYDGHRLNVATSRARALAIIVASPDLIRVACRTPPQMVLANALCRAWETPRRSLHFASYYSGAEYNLSNSFYRLTTYHTGAKIRQLPRGWGGSAA